MSTVLKLAIEREEYDIIIACLENDEKLLREFAIIFNESDKDLAMKVLEYLNSDQYARIYAYYYMRIKSEFSEIKDDMFDKIIYQERLAKGACYRAIEYDHDGADLVTEIIEHSSNIIYPSNDIFELSIRHRRDEILDIIIQNVPVNQQKNIRWKRLIKWCKTYRCDKCAMVVEKWKEKLEKKDVLTCIKNGIMLTPEEFDEADGKEYADSHLGFIIEYCVKNNNHKLIKHIQQYLPDNLKFLPYRLPKYNLSGKMVLALLGISIKHFGALIFMGAKHYDAYHQTKNFLELKLFTSTDCAMLLTYSDIDLSNFVDRFKNNDEIDWDSTLLLFLNTREFDDVEKFISSLKENEIKYNEAILIKWIIHHKECTDSPFKDIVRSSNLSRKELMEMTLTTESANWTRFIYNL